MDDPDASPLSTNPRLLTSDDCIKARLQRTAAPSTYAKAQVGKTIAHRTRNAQKHSLARRPRQPHRPRQALALETDHHRRTALLQCLEHLNTLPAASTYARHRRRVVNKALELLDMYAIPVVLASILSHHLS